MKRSRANNINSLALSLNTSENKNIETYGKNINLFLIILYWHL